MPQLPLYQVDAFADGVFTGNPAALCPLDEWLDEALMQKIAQENNQAETAYFVGGNGRYGLRWFTPSVEVDLCGHATLASAHLIFSRLEPDAKEIRFDTRSGELVVRREGDLIAMEFPAHEIAPSFLPGPIEQALGTSPEEVFKTTNYLVVYPSAADVAALAPNFALLAGPCKEENVGIIATAPADEGAEWDFVSRFFAPAHGIDEDSVTGSAHCTLVPYWAQRLGKANVTARQISARGGTLYCTDMGDSVILRGRCADYLAGTITI